MGEKVTQACRWGAELGFGFGYCAWWAVVPIFQAGGVGSGQGRVVGVGVGCRCDGTHHGLTLLPLGEDDEDAPMITGFSDDVPMVIA